MVTTIPSVVTTEAGDLPHGSLLSEKEVWIGSEQSVGTWKPWLEEEMTESPAKHEL